MKIAMIRNSDEEKFIEEVNNFIKDKKVLKTTYFQEVLTEEDCKFNFKEFRREIAAEPIFIYTAIIEYENIYE